MKFFKYVANMRVFSLIIVFVLIGLSGQVVYAQGRGLRDMPTNMTIYVTRAISDDMILPNTILSSSLISNRISIEGCPGEFTPATFTVHTPVGISSLTLNVSELTGFAGTIPSSAVNIRVVKCWYQDKGRADGGLGASGQKILVPELLVKDDDPVRIEDNDNYLMMSDGTYRWISDTTKLKWYNKPKTSEFPVKDSDKLQAVNIAAGENKQFWVLVRIPETAESGVYTGVISLSDEFGELERIWLNLFVLPFKLSPPMLEYDLFYFGESSTEYPDGSISSQFKSDRQMQVEFQNMLEHGIYNVSLGNFGSIRDWYNLDKLLTTKNTVGMGNRPLYYNLLGDYNYKGGLNWRTSDLEEREAIRQATRDVISFAEQYGVTDVYAYGLNENYDQGEILEYKPNFEAVHEAGGKVYIAGSESLGNYFNLLGDSIDMIDDGGAPDAKVAALWHSIGGRVFCYGNPQVGAEKPETYRRNYGLLLWQKDYDGTMNYAYQSGAADIWNDFDSSMKDHVFAYPTVDGVLDTLQWEGWREGVSDVSYLTTLLDKVEVAKVQGKDTSDAEEWLAGLKVTDLSTIDLDNLRAEMIDHILSLITPPTVFTNAASSITTSEATLNGNLIIRGSASSVTVSFEYGLTTRYGSTAVCFPPTKANSGVFNARITGLTSDTLYHYRIKAVGDGTSYGNDRTFTTLPNWWQQWWKKLCNWITKLRSILLL